MGFLVVKTGDSTCHPSDDKEGYLYHTRLGFTKQFSGISKQLETHFVKTIEWVNKQDKTISNPPSFVTKTLLLLFIITWAILISKVYDTLAFFYQGQEIFFFYPS